MFEIIIQVHKKHEDQPCWRPFRFVCFLSFFICHFHTIFCIFKDFTRFIIFDTKWKKKK